MTSSNRALISLGFTEEKFPQGTHICQIYSDEAEREAALFSFIASGLRSDERVACLSDKSTSQSVSNWLDNKGLDSQHFKHRSQLSFASTQESFFSDNDFKPEPMLDVLKSFYLDSINEVQSGARVIAEMRAPTAETDGSDKLMGYETGLCLLLENYPVTTVCQYDVKAFDGATILKVLKVHPLVIVRGAIIRNPFFIPAPQVLAAQGCC